jgi:hypothetical protein
LDHDLVAGRELDDGRFDRVGDRVLPGGVDLVERHAHADAVDLLARRHPADDHRDVIMAALAVGDVREEKRLALALGDAAPELPSHQRVHLGVLVDRAVDADQEAGPVERLDVLVEVGVGPRRGGALGS